MKLLAVVDNRLQNTMQHHFGCEIDFVPSWQHVDANQMHAYTHVIACGNLIESSNNAIQVWGIASQIRYFNIPAVFIDVSFETSNLIPRVYPQIKLVSWHGDDNQLMLQLKTSMPTLFHENPNFRNSTLSAHANALRNEAHMQSGAKFTGTSTSSNHMEQSSIPSRANGTSHSPASAFRKAGFGAGRAKDDSLDIDLGEISSISTEHNVISCSDEFEALEAAFSDSHLSKQVQAPKVDFNSKLNLCSSSANHLIIQRSMKDIMLGQIEFGTLIRVVHILSKLNQTGTLEISNEMRTIKLEFRQGKAYASGSESLIISALIWTAGKYNFNTSHLLSSNSKPINLYKLIRNAVSEHLSINPILRFLETEFNSYMVLTNCFDVGNHPLNITKWWEKCTGSTQLSEIMMTAGAEMDALSRDIYMAWLCDELIFTKSSQSQRAVVEYDAGKLRISNDKSSKDILAQSALGVDSAANSQLNAIRNDLLKVRASFDKEDGYTILGLNKGCGTKALDDAYYAWINRYHTDRFVRYKDPSFVKLANELMMLMNAMYARLSKAERRSTKPIPNDANTTVRRKPVTSSESHPVVTPEVSSRIGVGRARVSTIHTQHDNLQQEIHQTSSEHNPVNAPEVQTSVRNQALQYRQTQRAAIRPASVANIAAIDSVINSPAPSPQGQAVKMSDILARRRATSVELSETHLNDITNPPSSQTNPAQAVRSPSQTWAAPTVTPEQHFQTAKKKLTLGLSNEAYTALAWALEAEPENPDYIIYHAYASFLVDPSKYEEAIERITAMIEVLKASYPDTLTEENKNQLFAPYYFIGKIEIAALNYPPASQALQMAAKLNPNDLDTQRSLRYVAMQLEKRNDQNNNNNNNNANTSNKPKGLFSKFIDKLNVPL